MVPLALLVIVVHIAPTGLLMGYAEKVWGDL